MIRIVLPHHLRTLAHVGEVDLQIETPTTLGSLLDTLETRYPVLRGTIRDHATLQRRPYVRFFACGQDLSLQPLNVLLPEAVIAGKAPFRIVGAMAGG
jgi:hypothetical protein